MLVSFLTESTCGEPCWNAKEDVCRCSCRGANHGCLMVDGEAQPIRTRKLKGNRYELATAICLTGPDTCYAMTLSAVDEWLWDNAPELRFEIRGDTSNRKRVHTPTSPGGDWYVHTASRQAVEKWPELVAWQDRANTWWRPQLIWKRIQ